MPEYSADKNYNSQPDITQVDIADSYNYGLHGFTKNEAEALKWYLCGSETDIYCKYRAAILLLFKIGKEDTDFEKGIELLMYCSEAGYRDSLYLLANCCLYGHGTTRDPIRAGWYLSRILNFKTPEPDCFASEMLTYVYPKAHRLMLKLAECRKKQNLYTLPQTRFYDEGSDLCIQLRSYDHNDETDVEKIKHCIDAIESSDYHEGIVLVEKRLIWSLETREGFINYFKKAVMAGNTAGYLAIVLGYHFNRKYAERDYWIQESLKHGYVNAAQVIADEYNNQRYDTTNNVYETCWKAAVELYLDAGDAGSPDGYYAAAECYRKGGHGIEKNSELSISYLRKAAELQSEIAIEELIDHYTGKDETKAEYYTKLYEEGKWYRNYLIYDDICGVGRRIPESIETAKTVAEECLYYEENYPFEELEY